MLKTEVITFYCEDEACNMYEAAQQFAFLQESREAPAEWLDDPVCAGCGEYLE